PHHAVNGIIGQPIVFIDVECLARWNVKYRDALAQGAHPQQRRLVVQAFQDGLFFPELRVSSCRARKEKLFRMRIEELYALVVKAQEKKRIVDGYKGGNIVV